MWREPDEGIWEIRGQRQHFTYSKVSAWTAIDRAIKYYEARVGCAPRPLAGRARRDPCRGLAKGYDAERNTFVQYYGGTGWMRACCSSRRPAFCRREDPRVLGTIDAIQREICEGPSSGATRRRRAWTGLPAAKGPFSSASFWLVSALAKAGRVEEAERNLEQLMALQNDVGLLSEEYDPQSKRLLGNFPQAFSHIGLLRAIYAITDAGQ